MSTPDVSILVVNHNGRRHLEACLPSLEALDFPRERFEVIVVDNGSTDDSIAWTRDHHPAARIVAFERNLGFAPAYNRAVAQARGEFLIFLNNDTRVAPGWLRALVETAEREQAASVGSLILDWEGRTVDFAGGVTSIVGHAWSQHEGTPAAALGQPETALLFACAGSMLIRRDAWAEAGGFDDDYFAYFEDVDLGWRLSLLGHRNVLAPGAVTYHRLHGTSGGWAFSPRLRLYERNALFTIYKCLEEEHLACVLPVALMLTLARGLRYSSLPPDAFTFGRPVPDTIPVAPQTIATLLAIEEFGTRLPELRQKRERIQRTRRVADRDLWPLFRDPLRVHALGDAYESAARALYDVFGIARLIPEGPDSPSRRASTTPVVGRGFSLAAETETQTTAETIAEPVAAAAAPPPDQPASLHEHGQAGAAASAKSGSSEAPATLRGRPIETAETATAFPVVSVVVLTALGPKYLPACLDSLAAQTYPGERLEILVVDNGSAADPSDCVRQHLPRARVIRLPANAGFSAGNNVGARAARGELLVFLNDDTRAAPQCIEALVDAARRRRAAAVGALILSWDGRRLDFAGGGINFHGKGFQTGVASASIDRFRDEQPILFPCGAAMLVRRNRFLEIGGFDEELFAYYEDLALGWQLWLRGEEVWLAPQAVVYHLHHGTSREWKGSTRRYYERNALVNIFKLYETSTLARVLPAAVVLAVERALMWSGLAAVAHEHRIPRASALRRFYWRLKPRAVGRLVKGELAGHGARWNLGLMGSLRAVGVTGLLKTAAALVRFLFTDTQARLLLRWQYFIERGSQDRSFDARPAEVSGASGAILTALAEFADSLPRLAAARRAIQAARRRTDAEIVGRFPRHWLDADVTSQQWDYEQQVRAIVDAFQLRVSADGPAAPA